MIHVTFSIRFTIAGDDTAISKIRDFGEELKWTMSDLRLGDASDPDTATDELSVSLSSRRHLGEVRKLIRRLLAKYYVDAIATVTEL